jgi:hypothetical protein
MMPDLRGGGVPRADELHAAGVVISRPLSHSSVSVTAGTRVNYTHNRALAALAAAGLPRLGA